MCICFVFASYQCVFVDRLRPGEHSEPRPDLVKKILPHLGIQTLLDYTIGSVVYIWSARKKSSDLASVRVSNPFVELLAFHHQVTITRRNNSTPRREMQRQSPFWENFCILLGRDGPGRVDVVPGDHADRDARALALLDRGWHLGPHWILARTTSTQNHFLSQLKTFDPKIVHFLPPQCQQCRRRSC